MRLMAFDSNDMEATQCRDSFVQYNVGAAAGHVRSNRHCATLARACDNRRFFLILLAVEKLKWNTSRSKSFRNGMAVFYGSTAHKNRPTGCIHFTDFFDNFRKLACRVAEESSWQNFATARTTQRGSSRPATDRRTRIHRDSRRPCRSYRKSFHKA